MNRVAQHPVQAFLVALAAVGVLSVMDVVMKHLVIAVGVIAVTIWRSLVNLAFAAPLYLPLRKAWPSAPTLRLHIGRALLMTVMALLFFWGLGRVPVAQAIALTFIAPLIAMLLAALILGETIGPRSIGGSAVAFAGVVVIALGQARAELGEEALLGSAAILGSALCYAVNIILMRRQAMAAGPLEINFFQNLTGAVVWMTVAAAIGMPAWPAGQVQWIIVASILSTAGALLFAFAYARADANYLAVTEYSAFLWAAVLGWLVFREPLSLYTLAGAMLIVGGCLLAARSKVKAPGEVEAMT